MPEISRFFGIVIRMHFDEHDPPHFHAIYEGQEAVIRISDLTVYAGRLSLRALRLVSKWAELHHVELNKNWEIARKGKHPKRIKPLE